jgi:Uma2 family endonuclease
MVIQNRLYTVDEFEAFLALPENQERRFELINGEIVEKAPTEEHGIIVLRIGSKLLIFVDLHALGRVAVEVRHRIPADDHNARLPDISYRRDTSAPVVKQGSVPVMPDLAVEVKSPTMAIVNCSKKLMIISWTVRAWSGWSTRKSGWSKFTRPMIWTSSRLMTLSTATM